jgi:hypothetical protein
MLISGKDYRPAHGYSAWTEQHISIGSCVGKRPEGQLGFKWPEDPGHRKMAEFFPAIIGSLLLGFP